jgi:prophage tail gpP-like protein
MSTSLTQQAAIFAAPTGSTVTINGDGSTTTTKPPETMTLIAGGNVYAGWTGISITRALDRMATSFSIEASERWAGQDQPWQLPPFTPCVIKIGADVVLTGYIDDYDPELSGTTHNVKVTGRSKTEDVIDCTPDLQSGQFNGYTLDQIARAICAPFGVDVVVAASVGDPFPDASLERHETGFEFLERLSRLRSVLLSDNEQGNLVLTQAGSGRTTDALVQGANTLTLSAKLSGRKRFSEYRIKTQSGEGMAAGSWGGAGGLGSPSAPVVQSKVVTTTSGAAIDSGVPRYRPHTIIAESALTAKGAQARADWQMRFNAAKSIQAHISVQGWRQSDGTLWRVNTLCSVQAQYLLLDRELLIASVTYTLDDRGGRITKMVLGPVEGYTPDPAQVKVRKNKHKEGGAAIWNGAGGS